MRIDSVFADENHIGNFGLQVLAGKGCAMRLAVNALFVGSFGFSVESGLFVGCTSNL